MEDVASRAGPRPTSHPPRRRPSARFRVAHMYVRASCAAAPTNQAARRAAGLEGEQCEAAPKGRGRARGAARCASKFGNTSFGPPRPPRPRPQKRGERGPFWAPGRPNLAPQGPGRPDRADSSSISGSGSGSRGRGAHPLRAPANHAARPRLAEAAEGRAHRSARRVNMHAAQGRGPGPGGMRGALTKAKTAGDPAHARPRAKALLA
eukprot:scaffold201_cov405-Prasinococcus_capsulatus_cf.AAC.8